MSLSNELCYIAIDLETGGLNDVVPKDDQSVFVGASMYPIIEVGVIVLDKDFHTVDKFDVGVWKDSFYDQMHSWSKEHHTKSGLVQELKDKSGGHAAYCLSSSDAEGYIIQRLRGLGIKPYDAKARTGGIMLGNGIHFDREFIKYQMPDLHKFMHYRHYDVSSVQIAIDSLPGSPVRKFKKRYQHRALLDIEESVMEARHYRCELSPKNETFALPGIANTYEQAIEQYFRASYRMQLQPDREPIMSDDNFGRLCNVLQTVPASTLSPFVELLDANLLRLHQPFSGQHADYPVMLIPQF